MKYRYRGVPFPSGIAKDPLRLPLLWTRVRGPFGTRSFFLLVDSGAVETILPRRALDLVGITECTGEKMDLAGIGGTVSGADVFEGVKLEFGPNWRFGLKTRVVAHRDIEPRFAVLGRRDFFLRYFVGFDAGADLFNVSEPARSQAH
jgi:hypothetical protein